jgi:hypothetical protein
MAGQQESVLACSLQSAYLDVRKFNAKSTTREQS